MIGNSLSRATIQFGRHLSDYSPAAAKGERASEMEKNPNMTCPLCSLSLPLALVKGGRDGREDLSPFSPAVIHFAPNPLVTFGTDCSGRHTVL